MERIELGHKSFLTFDKLREAGVLHFTSTKQGWGNDGLARFTGDSPEVYGSFRLELAHAFKLSPEQLIFPRQTHSNQVQLVSQPTETADLAETDALITNQPNICLCVQTADCVPILLFDPVQQVIAAVHAGWRGTVSKLVSKTIHEMQRSFDTFPEDIIAGIGPSIHLHVYEVGKDVIRAVRENFTEHRNLLKPAMADGKAYFDLWAANKALMVEAGIPEDQVEIMGLCTYSHESLFYSARRDGVATGRMVSGIMLSE